MTGVLQDIPSVVKAVTDPFSFLALITVVLGLVSYLVIKKNSSARAAGFPVPLIALCIVAISLLALGFNVVRVSLVNNSKSSSPVQQLSLQVVFKGDVKHQDAITVPFKASSGQLNVGCGDTASTSVSWTLPPGARDINKSAAWQNAANLKSNPQSSVVQGSVVTATGQISGPDREWTGNCPGGGHGELVLSGTYVIDQTSSVESRSLPAFQGLVMPQATTPIDIPTSAGLSNLSCEVTTASNEKDRTTALFKLETSAAEPRFLVRENQQGPRTIDASLAGDKLLIRVI